MEAGDRPLPAEAAAELQKRSKSNTYQSLIHSFSFSFNFVVDARRQGRQFNGVVHDMGALWPDPNGPNLILNWR